MRRKNPVVVKVKAPSRGLVTRWPSESADQVQSVASDLTNIYTGSDELRACTVAQNVRFEDGVMAAGPGYRSVTLNTPLLAGCLGHWRFNEPQSSSLHNIGDPTDPACRDSRGANDFYYVGLPDSSGFAAYPQQVDGKLGRAVRFPTYVEPPPPPDGDGSAGMMEYANVWLRHGFWAYDPLINLVEGDLTVAFWFRTSDITVTQTIMAWPGFIVKQHNATLELVAIGPGNVPQATMTGGVSLVAGQWHAIVVRYQQAGQVLSLSIDGNWQALPDIPVAASPSPHDSNWYYFDVGNPKAAACFDIDSLTIWNRSISVDELSFLYHSGAGTEYPFIAGATNLVYEGNVISNAAQKPLFLGTTSNLYTVDKSVANGVLQATLTPVFTGANLVQGRNWRAADFYDKVVFAQSSNTPQYWDGAEMREVPGLNFNSLDQYASAGGAQIYDGVESFFGHLIFWKDDLIKWSDLNDFSNYIPVGITAISCTLATTGFTQPVLGTTVSVPVTVYGAPGAAVPKLVPGMYVRVDDAASAGNPYYNFYSVVSSTSDGVTTSATVVLKPLGMTGRTPAGTSFGANTIIQSVDANEAGQAQIVGANANGPIFQVVAVGDNAYIFKEWSIQSLQYVGQSAGTFFVRTEVVREGLVGRNSYVNLGNGSVVFLGHRELYLYRGGPTLTPVCRQYSRQLFDELDRTRLDAVVLNHRLHRNEVWISYPVTGGQKVLIWNYVENTATLDDYDQSLAGIASMTVASWNTDPVWRGLAQDLTWGAISETFGWDDFTGKGLEEVALVATGNGLLLNHGEEFSRDGEGYTALAETMDYDFGDSDLWK